ncbi:MAG TPA: ABC transporter permease [Dehalococcoidales bacterium]|nr:ABC transporter permease [Dehalococcoidales bacterium]
MNKTFLILKHEFINTITRKGFIIMALLFPLIGLAAIGIFQITQAISKPAEDIDIPQIGYLDEAGGFTDYTGDFGRITLVPYAERDEAMEAMLAGDIKEYFVIPTEYLQTGMVVRYHTEKELEMSGETYVAIRAFMQENLLKGQTGQEIIERIKNPLGVQSIRLDETGQVAADQGGFGAFLLPMAFGFLLIITIMSSSGYLLQGLGEEKENRIMEILLSSVSTRQLLIGKVLGLGGAGLIQIIFWLLSALFMVQLASSTIGGLFTSVQIPENVVILGIAYFILGYLFFAVIMAGIGAITASTREGSQLTVALIMPAILPFYVALIFLRDHPDHIIGTIMTLIPVTAPMSVFVRMGMSEIPAWEIAASILILILSIVGGLWLAAKLFRAFLLMYGKTPSLGKIIRLLRQA